MFHSAWLSVSPYAATKTQESFDPLRANMEQPKLHLLSVFSDTCLEIDKAFVHHLLKLIYLSGVQKSQGKYGCIIISSIIICLFLYFLLTLDRTKSSRMLVS